MREILMERRFFAVNSAGDNEFEHLLNLLDVPKALHPMVDEVRFDVDLATVVYDAGD